MDMNKIWFWVIFVSFVLLLYFNPNAVLPTMLSTGNSTIELCVTLLAVYAIWMGLLQIMEDSGLNKKLSKALKPATDKLFGKLDPKTNEYVCMNISANMLGMGGAATPMGIKAMKSMDDGSGTATYAMLMFFVLNATSLQLLPTTVIALRAAAGSANPSDIILPSLIATIASTAIGILLVILFNRFYKKKAGRNKKLRSKDYGD